MWRPSKRTTFGDGLDLNSPFYHEGFQRGEEDLYPPATRGATPNPYTGKKGAEWAAGYDDGFNFGYPRERTLEGFGDAKLIRGRIQWRGSVPPVVGIGSETIKAVRQRIADLLNALTVVLLRHGQERGFPVHEENLFDFFNKHANDEFGVIVDTLKQADGHARVGHLNSALMHYLNTLELVLDAKCDYTTNPDGAFE